ncbi:MAG: ubiquinol-cytochrome c reductase iron-sulfur subunit [Acetobacteraceae bacterium]|nr:ubiquinol-cytochrome c reductase iron-sulfur subunit [Acetobacteraceae bacterium]
MADATTATMHDAGASGAPGQHPDGVPKRDFLKLTAGAMAAVGIGAFAWPFIDSMNPASDVLALSTTEVDLGPVVVGQAITVVWRGKPVFVRHRTEAEITEARDVPLSALPDPQTDQSRVQKAPWLIVIGICTHLGCVPLGQKPTDPRGDYGGWFCPCHGSHYDTSGRIRKGPAPKNLVVPVYSFLTDTSVRVG